MFRKNVSSVRKVNIFSSFVTVVTLLAMLVAPVQAIAYEASLADSNFEIDYDANLIVNSGIAGAIDWATVTESRQEDLPSGQDDDSFGQGSKEDTPEPVVVSGSIPPNKSDLKTFGVYQEENAAGKFLHLFWTRVQDPSGTTNMDFEFNQSTTLSSNGVTPLRTVGDLLITYDLSKGGTVPNISLRRWTGSEWGPALDLSAAADATGSINTSPILAGDSDGLGALDPRTFGEASIDLSAIFDPTKCESFGSAYLKSRSSDSFTAALKDFIAPQPVNISNCGSVIIRKVTIPSDPGGVYSFGFTPNVTTDPANGSSFSLSDGGSHTINNVVAGGPYTVTEDDPSGIGFDLIGIDCSASTGVVPVVDVANRVATFDMVVGATVDCTYTNQGYGNIVVVKETNPSGSAQSFDFTTSYGSPFMLMDGQSNDSGQLAAGTYSVSEASVAGWATSASCSDGSDPSSIQLGAGETVTCTFVNSTGAILISKTTKSAAAAGDVPQAGATFEVSQGGNLVTTVMTGADGTVCVGGLTVGANYTVTETGAPTGYDPSLVSPQDVAAAAGECTTPVNGSPAQVSFYNPPLSEIVITFHSLAGDGVTVAPSVVCTATGYTSGELGQLNHNDSATITNLVPATYTCVIVVDP